MGWIGPVAGAVIGGLFGGGGGGSQTTSNAPWSGVQPYMLDSFGQLQGMANQDWSAFPYQQAVAGFTPETEQGLSMLSSLSGQLPGYIDPAMQAWQGVLDPSMMQGLTPDMSNYMVQEPQGINADINPYLDAAAQGAIRPITEQLTQQILPQISQQALATGGFSGSRRNLAEAQAVDKAVESMGDVTSGIYQQGYENLYGRQLGAQMQQQQLGQQAQMANLQGQLGAEGIGAQTRGQGLQAYMQALMQSPQMLQMLQQPAGLQMQVGGARQQQTQAEIDAQRQAYEYERDQPFNAQLEYLRALQGVPGGQTTSPAPYTSPLQGALSGAAIGQSISQGIQQNPQGTTSTAQGFAYNPNAPSTTDLFVKGSGEVRYY